MKRRTKEISKIRATGKAAGAGRVIRITEEERAAKCASRAKRGGVVDPAELFDRALQLGPLTKAS